MEINESIKENRISKKLTQKELGELLNVSDKTVSSWETGRTYPDISMIITLAEIFNLSLDTFLKGDEDMIKKMDKDLRFKNIYKYLLIIVGALVVGLYIFFSGYQNKNEWVDRINPLMEMQIGYATLPTDVTYNGGKEFQKDSDVPQYPDPYKNIKVLDSPFGDTSTLTFYGGKDSEDRHYALVKHKGKYVKEIAFIPWEAIPILYRNNMSREFIER